MKALHTNNAEPPDAISELETFGHCESYSIPQTLELI